MPTTAVQNRPRPRVSILIDSYNSAPWLRTCVDSALNQTQPADEVIVYDDGSNDGSLEILQSYGDHIRLIRGTHDPEKSGILSQGVALASLFAASSGDHLYLLDGDDKFLPEKIARYESAWAAQADAVLVQSPMQLIDENGLYLKDNYEVNKHRTDHLKSTYRQQDCDFYYSTSSLAFSRTYMSQHVPIDFSFHQDASIDIRLTSASALFGQILTLEECLSCWRQRAGSISRQNGQRTPLEATLRRNRIFNTVARAHGHPPIHLWLNIRFYRQILRRWLPDWVSAPFVHNPEGVRPKQ